MKITEYLLIPTNGDKEIIQEDLDSLTTNSKTELVEHYNNNVEMGFVGARRQALRIFAIGVIFKRVFGESPVKLEDKVILTLTGKIKLEGEKFIYLTTIN